MTSLSRSLPYVLALTALTFACGDDDAGSGSGTEDGTAGTSGGSEGAEEPGPTIDGVQLIAVAAYQGVKRELSVGEELSPADVPLIAGRDTMFRIYYTAQEDVIGESVTAVINIDGQEPVSVDTTVSALGPNESDINTTFSIEVPGELIGPSLDYNVELYVTGSNTASARYPAEGNESHVVEGNQQVLKLVLVPYAYGADGSNRVPDTSEAALAAYRERFLQLYPVSDVALTLHDPVPWGGQLTAFGQGWQQLMQNIQQLRVADGVSPETYYYGIANPADSFQDFCGFGCLLGVTLLNNSPADTGDPNLRWAVGIGYLEYATDTAVHEIGHSHGRAHVNCGQGLDPNSIDNGYPHDTNTIGAWGWDIVNGGLKDPSAHTDYMGYCMNQWTSDYTYNAMFNRGQNVNTEGLVTDPSAVSDLTIVSLDGEGGGEWLGPLARTEATEYTQGLSVAVTDGEGKTSQVTGQFYRFDHLPGGWLLLPAEAETATRVELDVDGVHSVVAR